MIEKDKIDATPLEANIIPFHFDVTEHSIPLDQFINTAKSTQTILNNFNEEFFGNKLKVKIDVLTPRKGGLIEILGIGVTGYVVKLFWEFLQSDVGKAYIKGLTGKEPAHWAEKAGERTKEYLKDESASLPNKENKKHQQKLASIIIAQITLGFLEKETEDLEKTGLSKESFRSAYQAKNQIYKACIDNTEVDGLGFDFSHNFPISRRDFPSRIIQLPEASQEEEEEETNIKFRVETPDLIVNSPNWKRDGRLWQSSTNEHNDIAFTIEDENFWHHVKIKDIKPDINDNMKVQWVYPESYSKPSKVRVLRVLTYNGKDISQPMNDKELSKELYDFDHEDKKQHDLFDPIKINPTNDKEKE